METKKIQAITIDLKQTTVIPLPQFIQGDTNILDFTIKENGVDADLSNIGRIVVNYKRPDKYRISRLLTAEDDSIIYELGLEENEVPGHGDVELQFYSTDNLEHISTKRFKVQLLPSIGTDTIYENDGKLTLLQELFVEVESLVVDTEVAADHAQTQGDYAKAQGDYVVSKKPDIDKFTSEQNNLQAQLDVLVIEGDSSPAAAQARVDGAGTTHATLKARLDTKDAQFSAQLAENVQDITQVDLVKLLQEHNEVATGLYAKVLGDRHIQVDIPIRGTKAASYVFKKDDLDDYIKFRNAFVGNLVNPSESLRKNYESSDQFFNTSNPPNYYTTVVSPTPASFTFSFYGTGFDFQHYADNRGGVWEFVVDGNSAGKVQVSTFSAATVWTKKVQVFRGLTRGNHTVVATFKGADPLNPPSGTARGWVKYNNGSYPGEESIVVFDDVTGSEKLFDILHVNSNKEFALSVRPFDSTAATDWLPDHGLGTVFAVSQKIYFDNEEITSWTSYSKTVKSVKIVQKMNGFHSGDMVNPIASIISIHTINAKGVSIKVKVTWLKKTTVGSGYGMMFPVYNTFAKKLITSLGNRYDTLKTDGTEENLLENDRALSYAYVNTGGTLGEPDTVVAMTIQDISKTFRYGKSGRRSPMVFLQHRDTILHKLYPMVYQNYTAEIGETYEIGGTWFIGELPMANDLLP